jgi:hypothetical protein
MIRRHQQHALDRAEADMIKTRAGAAQRTWSTRANPEEALRHANDQGRESSL